MKYTNKDRRFIRLKLKCSLRYRSISILSNFFVNSKKRRSFLRVHVILRQAILHTFQAFQRTRTIHPVFYYLLTNTRFVYTGFDRIVEVDPRGYPIRWIEPRNLSNPLINTSFLRSTAVSCFDICALYYIAVSMCSYG